jgi:hypothetical protein
MNELQTQTDQLLKALELLHHDNEQAAIARIIIVALLGAIFIAIMIRR